MPQVHIKHVTWKEESQVCLSLGLLSGKGIQFSITNVLLLLLDCRVRVLSLRCREDTQ